jgi:hypothetical protein
VKYNELIHFEPIESIVHLREANQQEYAFQLMDTYVISERMAEIIDELVIEQLQFNHPADNKGLLVVGNYGTGKSHLMSVISTIAETSGVAGRIKNERVARKALEIEDKFQVARIEIGSTTMPLRDIICGELEERLAELGVEFAFPPAAQVRNNKDAFIAMMASFHEIYQEQGFLLVVDELLDYLRGRKDQELILDLGFLREVGEICKNTRFRFIAGIQEMLFDNPKFQFVAEQLRRVKERFEQVYIVREDIAYVVAERLLKKDDQQKALIREHLQKFTTLYDKLSERLEEYVNLFPVHPAYLATFEKVIVAEKRVILKTISNEIKKMLEQSIPDNEPGLLSYDSYWPYIENDPSLKSNPDIREVMLKSKILQDRVRNAFTKPVYKPMALRIVHALSVHRLTTGDIHARLGVTSEELRDTLFLHADLPEEDAEFLRSTIDTVLREILKTVSWQYISFNEENGQYYIDIYKDIPIDDLIQNKAEALNDNVIDRYYFIALTQVMGCPTNTYVTNFKIWFHELVWTTSRVTRQGYLFFGAPNERSTAQPPRDFYLYFLQPFDPPKFKNEQKADEVFFRLKQFDEHFQRILTFYAAASELEKVAAAGTKHLYQEKVTDYLREVTKWLRDHMLEAFEVTYKGVAKKLSDTIINMPPQASPRELLDAAAQACLKSYFDEKYPDYPHFLKFKSPMTKDNLPVYVTDALKCISGATAVNGMALLDGLVLWEDGKLNVRQSGYARWILETLEFKAQNQVVNRSELLETIYTSLGTADVELTSQFQLEPELLVVLLASLVYNGDIVVTINGITYDAMRYDALTKLSLTELREFSHIKRPVGLPLPAIKALFELLGLTPGLLQPNNMTNGVIEMNRQAGLRLDDTVMMLQTVKSGIPCWDGVILSAAEQDQYRVKLEELKVFLEGVQVYNSPAKLHNFRYTVAAIEAQQEAWQLLKRLKGLQHKVQDVTANASYLFRAQQQLPDNHPWQNEVEAALSDLLHALKKNENCQKESAEIGRLKVEYQQIYLELHAKARLNAADDNRKAALLNDKRVATLKQLATIGLLPAEQLSHLVNRIAGLKACWNLTKKDLDVQTNCSQPHCKFRPRDEMNNKMESLSGLDDQVQDLLESWTKTLIENLNHPEIKENISLLQPEQQELVQGLLQTGQFSLPINVALLQAINELVQGIQKVTVLWADVKGIFGNGNPLTVEEANRRFAKMLQKYLDNQSPNRIRLVLATEKEE